MPEKLSEKKSVGERLSSLWASRPEAKRDLEDLDASQAFDALLASVGNGGQFQLRRGLFILLMGSFTAYHNIGAVFLAATPDFSCNNPYLPEKAVDVDIYNKIANYTTPWVRGNEGKTELSKCHYFDRGPIPSGPNESFIDYIGANEAGVANETDSDQVNLGRSSHVRQGDPVLTKCTSWNYNQSIFTSTVVTEWNLVCDKAWMKPVVQSTYMLGILTGAVVGSGFSDRYGRRPALMCCIFLFFSCATIAAFSNSLGMFLLFRFILGAAGQGVTLIKFVWVTETTGRKNRDFYGNMSGVIGFTAGEIVLSLLAYQIRAWRTLQLVTGASIAVLFLLYWILPESPRWLLMNGHTKKGLEVLTQIGKGNGGRKLPENEELEMYLSVIRRDVLAKRKEEKRTCYQGIKEFLHHVYLLVGSPNMRRRSLIMFYNWFVVSMCFYGAVFSGENINVSLHALYALGAASGILKVLINQVSAIKLGRRITLCHSMILSGVCLVAIAFVPRDIGWINLTLVLISRMMLGVAFYCVFFYSVELVPTKIRNTSIGMSSMWARIGSAVGPFIVDLLGAVYYFIPSTVFGVLCLAAGLLCLLLPETSRTSFPETIEEIELLPR